MNSEGYADRFVKVLDLEVPWAHSYADMQPGRPIVSAARTTVGRRAGRRAGRIESIPADSRWWAFRIGVQKAGRALDVDNVAKTIIDAFCSWQIVKDQSPFTELGLFPNDTFDHVRVLQVVGERGASDSTRIEIPPVMAPLTSSNDNAHLVTSKGDGSDAGCSSVCL